MSGLTTFFADDLETKPKPKPKPKRYISEFPKSTPYEAEIIGNLIEEAGEVIVRANKMLRFGADEMQPGQSFTNKERLSEEVGNLQYIVGLLTDRNLLRADAIQYGIQEKHRKLPLYLQNDPS